MPGEHRRALQAIEQGPSIRTFVLEHFEELTLDYDEALRELYAFRNQHKVSRRVMILCCQTCFRFGERQRLRQWREECSPCFELGKVFNTCRNSYF
jgi:hypothetical protein